MVSNLNRAALYWLFWHLFIVLLLAFASPKPNQPVCQMALLYGIFTACTNLHILLRTAEKHHLEHLAASAQAWGASPNLQYEELTPIENRKEIKVQRSKKTGTSTIVHKHLLLLATQLCFSRYHLHAQPVFSPFPAYLHLCTQMPPKASVHSVIRQTSKTASKITKLAEV